VLYKHLGNTACRFLNFEGHVSVALKVEVTPVRLLEPKVHWTRFY
jgi:hypothetical protein